MGLLISDTALIDSMLDEPFCFQDNLVEYVYAGDSVRDEHEHEVSNPTAWPSLLTWLQRPMAGV
jgi:hypothetical protein